MLKANENQFDEVKDEVIKNESVQCANAGNAEGTVQSKQSTNVVGIIALLVALSIGAGGFYWGMENISALNQKILDTQSEVSKIATMPKLYVEKSELTTLEQQYQQALGKVVILENEQSYLKAHIGELQNKLNQFNHSKMDSSAWLLSDADFLLNNALRKIVLDNDLDSAKNLLIEADNVLSGIMDAKVLNVREAIKADLNALANINEVDQNGIMQRLAQLANNIDDLPLLDTELDKVEALQVSHSVSDWQENLLKSINSFLDNFIRISNKNSENEKVLIAPHQDIYLRENIRLRLQIAILTVPRQQNELYKQSIETVSSWVRSYFAVNNDNVKHFLRELDALAEQSIYIDAPTNLQSLTLLEQLLNKVPKKMDKVELGTDKTLGSEEAILKNEAENNNALPVEGPSPQNAEIPVQ